MPRGIASAKQLSMMAKLLDAYCEKHAISNDVDRNDLAALLLTLFDSGARTEEALSVALEHQMSRTSGT
jgi:hypothetical protein